ncbi:hypothetical protein K431DRAFT_6904 [Polychaeton citri CBS 116435]|uniref:Uncharacterized protein n=1 Tax=Polychaeton citri CBS 116435 TaxID=1314669 RepID=A0A9P4QHF8_9PEZI|nr:hypothetical protein K431DRAFT_6904 [Polychaeton citri CBS 116435]
MEDLGPGCVCALHSLRPNIPLCRMGNNRRRFNTAQSGYSVAKGRSDISILSNRTGFVSGTCSLRRVAVTDGLRQASLHHTPSRSGATSRASSSHLQHPSVPTLLSSSTCSNFKRAKATSALQEAGRIELLDVRDNTLAIQHVLHRPRQVSALSSLAMGIPHKP